MLSDAARVVLAICAVFCFLLLILSAIAWWLEDHSAWRDEDEELGPLTEEGTVYRLVYHYELARIRPSLSPGLRRELAAAATTSLRRGGMAFQFAPSAADAEELDHALKILRLVERATCPR